MIAMSSAVAATPTAKGNCNGVNVELTKQLKQEYLPLVIAAMGVKVDPGKVSLHKVMESRAWSAVYVSTPVADDGVMFFQSNEGQRQFRDVWGGWAEPSEMPQLIAWATTLGAPKGLATCFAETVTGGL